MRTQSPTELDPVLTDTVRRLYVQPVDPDRARRNVATIAEMARVADQNRGPAVSARATSPARGRRTPLWRPALAVAAALVAVPGGMATAGVAVPEPFDAPYRAVGVSLPNQGAQDAERTTRGRSSETPAATTPARTSTTRSSAATPAERSARRKARKARAEGKRRASERKARAEREQQRSQGATPAVPATPAQPSPNGGPALRATPATPAQPAKRQERSTATQTGRGPELKTELPRRSRQGRALGRLRDAAE